MYFLIDGYNLLFNCIDSNKSFQIQREGLLKWMQDQFRELNLSGIVVFDGGHQMPNECEISFQSPLEIAYTPKGKTADSYIFDRLSYLNSSISATVVTNDKGLLSHCRIYRPNTMSNNTFIRWLIKKSKTSHSSKLPTRKETPFQVDRLTKIFEDKLKSKDE